MGYSEAQYIVDEVLNKATDFSETGLPITDVTTRISAGNKVLNVFFDVYDLKVGDEILSRFKDITIRIKENTVPQSIDDGDLIGVFGRDDMHTYSQDPFSYSENIEEGKTYTVRFFPRSDHGVISYAEELIQTITIEWHTVFGFHQDFTNLDPDSSITYIADCKNFTPMMKNASKGELTDGSWNEWDWLKKVRPFVLNVSGDVEYALNPNDYTKKTDGSASFLASPVNDTNLECYTWIPKLYVKEVYAADGLSRDVYFSERNDYENTFDFVNRTFINANDEEIEGIWLGMYYLRQDGKCAPETGTNYVHLMAAIGTSGSDYKTGFSFYHTYLRDQQRIGFADGLILNLLRDIQYMLFKTTNIQSKLGIGRGKQFYALNIHNSMYLHINNPVYTNGAFYGDDSGSCPGKAFHCQSLACYDFPTIGYWTPGVRCVSRATQTDTNTRWRYEGLTTNLFKDTTNSQTQYSEAFNPSTNTLPSIIDGYIGFGYSTLMPTVMGSMPRLDGNLPSGSAETGSCDGVSFRCIHYNEYYSIWGWANCNSGSSRELGTSYLGYLGVCNGYLNKSSSELEGSNKMDRVPEPLFFRGPGCLACLMRCGSNVITSGYTEVVAVRIPVIAPVPEYVPDIPL